jgi:gluconolactonase
MNLCERFSCVFSVLVALSPIACGSRQSGGPDGGTGGTTGGAAAGGSGAVAAGGAGESAGGAGGGAMVGATMCPAGVTGAPVLGETATRVPGVPISDAFNMNDSTFGNVEGPVWIGGALYVSEMSSESYDSQNRDVLRSRILKVTSDGQVSIAVADSGSNGLAVDADGNIVAAVHKDGTIKRITLPSGAMTVLTDGYMGARFDAPNDLSIHSNGTIYFSDPDYQAPSTRPQAQTRVYRLPAGGTPEPIPSASNPDNFTNPNGVTLSLREDYLYVAAGTGRRYPVMPDGTLGAGANFDAASRADGMAIDCAGNLYVARSRGVDVYTPEGTSLGRITVPDVQSVTNVAFGGADRQTLFITGLGDRKGLFQVRLSIPGKPY